MKRVIIAGSPRSNGRTAKLAETLFEACIEDCPEDEVYLVPVSELDIGPCIGCGGCSRLTDVEIEDSDGQVHTEQRHMCVFDDDMTDVYDLLLEADELIVVSPVYFSGAPAPMKALLDRLQPFFYQWREENKAGSGKLLKKRPAVLHVIGEGGDPNGYVPLVSEVRSALAVAGFKLERLFDWVGRIDENGEILRDADEHGMPELGDALTTFTYDAQGNIMSALDQILSPSLNADESDESDDYFSQIEEELEAILGESASEDADEPEKKSRPQLDFSKVEEPVRKQAGKRDVGGKRETRTAGRARAGKDVKSSKPAKAGKSPQSSKGTKSTASKSQPGGKGAKSGGAFKGAKPARQTGASKSVKPARQAGASKSVKPARQTGASKSSKGKRRG